MIEASASIAIAVLLATAAVPIATTQAMAVAPAELPGNQCEIGGWSTDSSRRGLAVRARPSVKSAVIGRLQSVISYEGGLHSGRGVEFAIVEARNGWFRIQNIQTPGIVTEDREPVDVEWRPSKTEGWIPGKAIFFVLQTFKGFAAPDPNSPVLFQSDDWYGPKDWLRVADCSGEWVQIAYGDPKRERFAWFRGVCAMQETTCDGVEGDR